MAVDDDVAMAALIGKIVERMGHRCRTASSGKEAVDLLAHASYDLIVTDVNMPGLSGLGLLEAARTSDPDVAVIVVSGVDNPETAEAALAGGAFGYVVKPFEVTQLQVAVSNALRRRELELELRRNLRELQHQATHDHLTGLPNRRRFREQLSDHLDSLSPAQVLGLLLIDIDQFKLVNDTYGHEAGDQLIVTMANQLVECAPTDASIARLGGDEYVVAIVGDSEDDVLSTAERMRLELRRPVSIIGVELTISTSIGVAFTTGIEPTVSGLLRCADMAMHNAKARRDTIEVFDDGMAHAVSRRLALTSELRRAVDDGLLTVHYQPIVETTSERLVGLEALARWTHHEWGRIGPNEFIPLAESIGLVHEIDLHVLRTALTQLGRWRTGGHVGPEVFVSVNLSASQLVNSALPELVEQTLARSGLTGSALCLEVTEGTLVTDVGRAVPILQQLRQLGVKIAVDDFGTGHSALSYLGQLPLDILKIDQTFIAAIGSDRVDIIDAIVDLAHRFELAVIAEGVEHQHQLARLRRLPCDMVQGYLIGRAVDADKVVSPVSDRFQSNSNVSGADDRVGVLNRSEV